MQNGLRVAITGGASGLGKALALHYASQGWRVAIADVQEGAAEDALSELLKHGVDAFFTRCDVRRVEDVTAWKEAILERWGGLEVLVNNAGVAAHGLIDEAPLEDWEWIIDINLMGVVRGCKVFTPLFKAQGQGHIVNIASLAGLIHAPEMSSYNATKAAVVALSETLYLELTSSGIAVSVVCPAFFPTNLTDTMRSPSAKAKDLTRKLFARSKLQAHDVAKLIYEGVEKRQYLITSHWDFNLMWYLKRFAPPLYRKLMEQGGKKLHKRQRKAGT